jgi:hypothetical protein
VRTLSAFSVISLIFFALALCPPLFLTVFMLNYSATGPAEGAAYAFLLFICLGMLFVCTLLGVLTGWIGARRSRDYPELPWAGLALNSALLLLQLVVPPLLLAASEPGASWVVGPMILIVGTIFVAMDGAIEFARQPLPVSLAWRWFLGLVCGALVSGLVLRVILGRPADWP